MTVLYDPSETRARNTDVRVMERGIEAESSARIAVWSSAGRIGRFWIFSISLYTLDKMAFGVLTEDACTSFEPTLSFSGVLVICNVT